MNLSFQNTQKIGSNKRLIMFRVVNEYYFTLHEQISARDRCNEKNEKYPSVTFFLKRDIFIDKPTFYNSKLPFFTYIKIEERREKE